MNGFLKFFFSPLNFFFAHESNETICTVSIGKRVRYIDSKGTVNSIDSSYTQGTLSLLFFLYLIHKR